ncbi:MAG: hypothetical protein DCC53_07915 [Chloroflexi bacterium]|nr:MAG: hypothetical protein DCC53_07915 [Chloroflexota bacterium]
MRPLRALIRQQTPHETGVDVEFVIVHLADAQPPFLIRGCEPTAGHFTAVSEKRALITAFLRKPNGCASLYRDKARVNKLCIMILGQRGYDPTMNDHIRYHYDDIEQAARRFRDHAQQVEDMLQRSMRCVRLMDEGAWIGEGADEYRFELESLLIPALRKLHNAVGDTAWALLRAIEMIQDADQMISNGFEGDLDLSTIPSIALGTVGIGGGTGFGGFGARFFERFGAWMGSGMGTSGATGTPPEGTIEMGQSPVSGNIGGRMGRGRFFNPLEEMLNSQTGLPDFFGGPDGPVQRPPWFTEFDDTGAGVSGAPDSSILVAGAGDPQALASDIVKTSQATGGGGVSGVFNPDSDAALRGPGALPGGQLAPNVVLSPAARAMVSWIKAHPDGTLILPPFSAGTGAEALAALANEGFDLSGLNIATVGTPAVNFPEGLQITSIESLSDLAKLA